MSDTGIVRDARGHGFRLNERECPTCLRPARRTVGYRGGPYHRYGEGVATLVKQCGTCRLLFPDPFPEPVDPQELYGDPAKYFERHDEAQKIEGFKFLIRKLIDLADVVHPSVLDIGSGRGECLRAAQLEGLADVTGLELASAMIEHADATYGIPVLKETVEVHAARVDRHYDGFFLSAVLEHVGDPDSTIASIAKLSRPGSILYIDVPNEPNLLTRLGNGSNRLRGSKAIYNLSPTFSPYHVWGFNRRALGKLLEKHGYRIQECRIWADPRVPSAGAGSDRLRAWVGTQVNRVGNRTGMGANMFVWAVYEGPVASDRLPLS